MKRIILASASPRRREILRITGLKFKIDASDYEEDLRSELGPRGLARHLSREKAMAVSKKYRNSIIIAADTFIVFRGKIFGKPRTAAEAKRMLRELNGKTHSVISGFTILDTGSNRSVSRSVETRVTLRKLTMKEIESYVRTGEPLDKAGAYAIQGLGALIVKKMEGDYFNVVGLPLAALAESLKEFGIRIL